jgi:hypothetical protein
MKNHKPSGLYTAAMITIIGLTIVQMAAYAVASGIKNLLESRLK